MEGHLFTDYGKMGHGVLRYLPNPIVAVIDSENSGKNIKDCLAIDSDVPVVDHIDIAISNGAEVLILGIASSGGKIPESWFSVIDRAILKGLSIINGLHDELAIKYKNSLSKNQWIWDVRIPQFIPQIAAARAIKINNKRILCVGTDMACGKMTTSLELFKWAKENNLNWEKYWKNNESNLIHFIGKDNIVFHCIIFPIILKELGNYNLPVNVPANEFLNLEGRKLSTSKNGAIWLHEYLNEFKDKQDALRYTLCATAPENKDTDFTWKDFQARNNNELVAIFGNFVNRVIVLTHKYYGGIIPKYRLLSDYDENIISEISKSPFKISTNIEKYKFREALNEVINLARIGNKYLAETEPWKLIKSDEEKTKAILNTSIQIVANLAILCQPFLPFTSKKLFNILNIPSENWHTAGKCFLEPGHKINDAVHLFNKIEDEEIEKQLNKLKKND